MVKNFRVVETEHIKAMEVHEYVKGFIGKPLFGVDLQEIAEAVELHPWVASVAIRRAPPHEVVIEPIERTTIALAHFVMPAKAGIQSRSVNLDWLIDEHGNPFKMLRRREVLDLPVIKAKRASSQYLQLAAAAIRSYALTKQLTGKISEIVMDNEVSLKVVFSSGLMVELGNDKFSEKWLKLEKIWMSLSKDSERLAYIYLGDYPNPQQVAVKFKVANDS